MDGAPKACLRVGERTLLQRVNDVSAPLGLPIWLIRATSPAPALASEFEKIGLPQLVDQWPDAGPLGALATAFDQTTCQRLLLLACDLPFLTTDFLDWLVKQTPAATAVVPSDGKRHHPLCAVYDRACHRLLQEKIESGKLRAHSFLDELEDVVLLPPRAWKSFDDGGRLLANINTAEDLEDARQFVTQDRGV